MITTFYPPYSFGGDGVFVRQLSNELVRQGHKVDVIHCIDSYRLLAGQEPTGTYDDHPDVNIHGLKSRFGLFSPLSTQQTGYPFFKSVRVKQILKKGFDVIHYHNISLVGGPKILQYGQGIKLYTTHEYWLLCPTHLLYRFKSAVCKKPHCFLCSLVYGRLPQWWRYSCLLENSVKHINAFIMLSRFTKDIHHKLGHDIPFFHLPNFISTEETASVTSGQPNVEVPEEPYFLFVGRLEKLKGLQTLIPVFHRYSKALLLIAGRGAYGPHLRKLAKGSAKIRFLGHLSARHLQDLYRRATALIVPSVCFEVSPFVIIEAFREKTPVIVRNIGGMPEIIKESGGGVIYETDEELVKAMDQLLANRPYQSELGLRGYQAYQQNWTAEAYMKRYFALIHDISVTRDKCSNEK